MRLGKYAEAIEHFKRAMAQGRNRAEAMADLGAAYESADLLPQAYIQFKKALAIRESGELHLGLSALLRRYGKLREAAAELQRVCQAEPTDAYAHFRLAEVLRANGFRKSAAQAIAQAVANAPDDAFYHYWNADLLLEMGEFEASVEAARAAVELSPADEHLMVLAALGLWGCDKRAEAIRAARLATELVTDESRVTTLVLWKMLTASGHQFEADALVPTVNKSDRFDRETAMDLLAKIGLDVERQPYMR